MFFGADEALPGQAPARVEGIERVRKLSRVLASLAGPLHARPRWVVTAECMEDPVRVQQDASPVTAQAEQTWGTETSHYPEEEKSN